MTNLPPAPDANQRLNLPAPTPGTSFPNPGTSQNLPPIEVTPEAPKVNKVSTTPKNYSVFEVLMGVIAFFAGILPIIGILIGGFALFFILGWKKRFTVGKKAFVWATVLAGLGILASIGATSSFFEYLAKH